MLSLADFQGRKVIGITEGLLGKLNRRQIEAVVGHEVAHILSGDCFFSTVTCSLFEFYSSILQRIELVSDLPPYGIDGGTKSKINVRMPRFDLYIFFVYSILAITRYLSYLVNIFLSRQREYRADAISARLTRDPLSLAEVLYIISRGWRGAGMPGSSLSSVFMVNPCYSALDEGESFFSNMF